MNVNKLNNLLELFFVQYQNQNEKNILLSSLKETNNQFSWEKTFLSIKKLADEIKKYTLKNRSLLTNFRK